MDRDRVLAEMVEVGLTATELGPDGYLPTDPGELREYLSSLRSHGRGRISCRPSCIDPIASTQNWNT